MSKKTKRTKDEMKVIARELELALFQACGKKPFRITTNFEFTVMRIIWCKHFEKMPWYDHEPIQNVIAEFIQKYKIHIHEIERDKDPRAQWLTK